MCSSDLLFQHTAAVDSANASNWSITLIPTSGSIQAGDNADITLSLGNTGGSVGTTALLRFESRQTSTSGGLSAYSGFITIPVLIVS